MKRPSRFTLVFITVMIVYILVYVLNVTVNPKYPFESDMPNYAVALAQSENPELYSRDPVFKDGVVTGTLWSSSYAYMRLFQGLYNLTQNNMSATMALLQLIPAFTFCLTFYWLLCAFPLDRWLCLVFSVGMSYWLILNRLEGLPSVFYFACIPLFLRLLWQFIVEPSLHSKPVVLWRAVLIGMVIGFSPLLINSVNGLAFNLLTLCLMTALFLARGMRWQSYAALLVGLIPCLGVATLSGAGGANALQDSEATLHLFNLLPVGSLVVSLHSSFIVRFTVPIFGVDNSWLFYFPLFASIVGLSAWIRYAPQPTRTIKIIYLTLSMILWLWTLGNLGILLYVYYLYRFWRRSETLLDYVLITGMNAGVFIGPILLWISIGVWKIIQWHSLVFVMSQMFRFHLLTYFIAGVAVVFMIEHLTDKIGNVTMRRLLQFMFILGIGVQETYVPMLSINFLVMLSMVLIFLRMASSSKRYFTRSLFAAKSGRKMGMLFGASFATLALLLVLGFWGTWGGYGPSPISLDPANLLAFSQKMNESKNRMKDDYLDMAEWLRLNTPQDSLIHFDHYFEDRTGFFRFLTRRAMFYNWMDIYVGQYSPGLAANNRELYNDWHATFWPLLSGPLIVKYNINYVVIHTHDYPPLPIWDEGGWYVPKFTYSNTNYKIYHVEKISLEQLFSGLLVNRSDT